MRIVPSAGHVAGVFRDVEAHAHMALRAEVVDFVRPDAVDEPGEIQRIARGRRSAGKAGRRGRADPW